MYLVSTYIVPFFFRNLNFWLCFADPPEITGEQSYIQEGSEGIKLELVCIVHASPKANVTWYKDGHRLQG